MVVQQGAFLVGCAIEDTNAYSKIRSVTLAKSKTDYGMASSTHMVSSLLSGVGNGGLYLTAINCRAFKNWIFSD